MPTPYSDIFDKFLSKVSDYSFLNLELTELEDILTKYLKSAIVKFKQCNQNLSDKDDVNKTFNIDLTEEEQEILATLLIVEWLNPFINSTEVMKQFLSSKDYTYYSQANHLKELRILRDDSKSESQQLMISYSYTTGNIDELV